MLSCVYLRSLSVRVVWTSDKVIQKQMAASNNAIRNETGYIPRDPSFDSVRIN